MSMTNAEATAIWKGLSKAQRNAIRRANDISRYHASNNSEQPPVGFVDRPYGGHGATLEILEKAGLVATRHYCNGSQERGARTALLGDHVEKALEILMADIAEWKAALAELQAADWIKTGLERKASFLTARGLDLYDALTDEQLRKSYDDEYGERASWPGRRSYPSELGGRVAALAERATA